MIVTEFQKDKLIEYQWRCKCGWACYVTSEVPLTRVQCRGCGVALEQGQDKNKAWKVVKTDEKGV